MAFPFLDRSDAGYQLARKLLRYSHRSDVLVLGLARGGVPVAYEVAVGLGATLDVFLVRKLGVPGHEELAMGAIASGGVRVLNEEAIRALQIPPEVIDSVAERELREMERREAAYRGSRPQPQIQGRVVILVDDGLATGSSMRAALAAVRRQAPARTVVAVPVAAKSTCRDLLGEADEVVCAETPVDFYAVSAWYVDFSETTDEEIRELFERAVKEVPAAR